METTPGLCPAKFRSLFTLQSETSCLGRAEPNGLAITADKELSVARIDPVFGKSTQFGYSLQNEES
jgi:hypothetical protein